MRALAGLLALVLVACAAAEAPAQPEQAPVVKHPIEDAGLAHPPPPQTLTLRCAGAFTQGGIALCRTLPNAQVSLDGLAVGSADADGWVVLGFTREHGELTQISASANGAGQRALRCRPARVRHSARQRSAAANRHAHRSRRARTHSAAKAR